MILRCLFVLVVHAACLDLSGASLVRVGEVCEYFKGVTEPPGPSGAWQLPGYNSAAWLKGPSGFSTVNGTFTEATTLGDYGPTYTTVFMRRSFQLTETNSVKWLTLRVDYNDGFVAYLNGKEVARRNMPAGPVGASSAAAGVHNRGVPEDIDISAYRNLLVKGENVLAISIHGDGSGFDYYFCLTPELRSNFSRGPVLQNASSNSVQVIWKTVSPGSGMVEFGTSTNLGRAVLDPVNQGLHAVVLTGLFPDTLYYYRVSSTIGNEVATSEIESFRTFKTSGKISFVLAGDLGAGLTLQYNVAQVMKSQAPDLVIQVGDIIYPWFSAALADIRHFSIYEPQMKNTPFFYAIGNHDSYFNPVDYYNTFYLPTNKVTGAEQYYSFDHGDAHFVMLNSDLQAGAKYEPGSDQYNWLEADLAATRKPWKFLFFHHTMRTSSYHSVDDYDGNGELDTLQLQRSFGTLAAKYGVKVVFNAHDHIYEKMLPMNGVYNVTSGGGGALLYALSSLRPDSAQFWVQNHCVKVSIDGSTLALQAIDLFGNLMDSMNISLAAPTNEFSSVWSTPELTSKGADDGDGNIVGQKFDFEGQGIASVTGEFSNLGRLFVSNDRTNLYLGLKDVMIGPDQNVFLFIESPRLKGVTNMINIGNGLVDPDGQGADGLDFLGNLSFTNFSPVVGCILGDEFADDHYRYFERPGLNLNVGQGVFYLDAGITDVPGIQIQQYNRNPQTGATMGGEQNANFIEVGIPLSALGSIKGGDTIKIGGVVGLGGFNTNKNTQSRELDTAFVGLKMYGHGQNNVLLEPLTIKLSTQPIPTEVRLQIARGRAPNGYQISWSTNPGKQYVLQSSGNPASGYQDLPKAEFPMKAGNDEFSLTYEDIITGSLSKKFYRVRVLP
jgi:hypothetical protein